MANVDVTLNITRVQDSLAIEGLFSLFRALEQSGTLSTQCWFEEALTQASDENGALYDWAQILAQSDTYYLRQATLKNDGLAIFLNRDTENAFDKLRIRLTPQLDTMTGYKLIQQIDRLFKIVSPGEIVGKALGSDAQKHYNSRELFLKEQERQLGEFFVKTQGFILEQAESYRQKSIRLEDEFRLKQEELELQYLEKSAILKAREAELDTRSSKYARRAENKEFITKLTEIFTKPGLSTRTEGLRKWPILTSGILFACVLGLAVYFLFLEPRVEGSTSWIIIYRQVLLTFTAGAIGTFFIRLQHRWFQRNAEEEFRLRRLELDMRRATWLVELAQEWREQNKEGEKPIEMPIELVNRLGRSLFSDGLEPEMDIHPLETMVSGLIGSSGTLEVKSAGGGMKVDRQNMSKSRPNEE